MSELPVGAAIESVNRIVVVSAVRKGSRTSAHCTGPGHKSATGSRSLKSPGGGGAASASAASSGAPSVTMLLEQIPIWQVCPGGQSPAALHGSPSRASGEKQAVTTPIPASHSL